MNEFFPVSDFPLFPKIVQTPWNIFPILPFPKKCRVSSAKIFYDHFLSLTLHFSIFPVFPTNSPCFEKTLSFPHTFNNFPLFSFVLCLFLKLLYVFSLPLF